MRLFNAKKREPLYTEADYVGVPSYDLDYTLPEHIISKVEAAADEDNGRYGIELLAKLYYDVWENQVTELEANILEDPEFLDWATDTWKLIEKEANPHNQTLSDWGMGTFLEDVINYHGYHPIGNLGRKGEKLEERLAKLHDKWVG